MTDSHPPPLNHIPQLTKHSWESRPVTSHINMSLLMSGGKVICSCVHGTSLVSFPDHIYVLTWQRVVWAMTNIVMISCPTGLLSIGLASGVTCPLSATRYKMEQKSTQEVTRGSSQWTWPPPQMLQICCLVRSVPAFWKWNCSHEPMDG